MPPITASQLRSTYLAFFARHGHAVIPPASLVPANDPSVLFTTAGMHPLAPYLLGEPHPAGRRLVNVQKCVRTGDIDAVGDDTHLTWFEMLGNWSLGDYGRDEAIAWSFEFLTGVLGLPLDRLGVTCFAGDRGVPADEASAAVWRRLGVPEARIARLGRDDNWWGPAGTTGPCGPDTEIFFWTGPRPAPEAIDVGDRRWVEIWNNVFMSYTKTAGGEIVALPRVNVDTGMGVERTLVALNGLGSVYEVDTMAPLVGELRGLARAPHEHEHELRVVADHVRAACFVIADGVAPSNKDRGYVLRRLVRRAVVFARRLGLPADWYARAAAVVARGLGDAYPELARDPGAIVRTIGDEVGRFEHALAHGLRLLENQPALDGKIAFDLLQTHGFPFELTRELAEAAGKPVDEDGFRRELEAHRARSRPAAGGATFRGGLADHSAEIVRYHTVTHLLQAALREVLGPHVIQRGSNLTHERLRFDFSHGDKPAPGQLAAVEARVNGWLGRDLIVERAVMPVAEARALGAIGAFGDSYGAIVSVYSIVDRATGEVVSREFCGGPHVGALDELRGRRLQIVREQAISSGIRRIKAVLAPADPAAEIRGG
ncbi:MAG TPA: alanine--tRNA ligase [Kofleriaceae bacterium]|jgi:alanyl-tRNA synthetase